MFVKKPFFMVLSFPCQTCPRQGGKRDFMPSGRFPLQSADAPFGQPSENCSFGVPGVEFPLINRRAVYITGVALAAGLPVFGAPVPVADKRVVNACGFSSSQYFATVFSRCTGGSPKVFRSRQQPAQPGHRRGFFLL